MIKVPVAGEVGGKLSPQGVLPAGHVWQHLGTSVVVPLVRAPGTTGVGPDTIPPSRSLVCAPERDPAGVGSTGVGSLWF